MHSVLTRKILLPACSLAMAAAVLTGCGGSDGSDEPEAANTGTQSSVVDSTEVPIAAPKPEPGQPAAEEQPAPYGEGSTESQAVGVTIDGMQLNDVRWSDNGSYFRIVFDMGTPEGDPVLQIPHAEASLSEDGETIKVVLSGIRSIGSSANAASDKLAVNDAVVTSIQRIDAGDDQAMIYEIELSRKANFSLAGLGSPGRIVVDINR